MALVILKMLDYKVRYYSGVPTAPLAAFVGAAGDSMLSFGIGLISEDCNTAQFWGLAMPHSLITSYRGMQVLDNVTELEHGTICACYYAGGRDLRDSELHYIDDLREQIPEISDMRETMLAQSIPDGELDEMLEVCNSTDGIDLAIWELEKEIEAGAISRTPGVERAFEIAQAERARYERNEELAAQELPADQSFEQFCKDFRIEYLCDAPVGMYGWDWGHTTMDGLDKEIVYSSLQYEHPSSVFCTEFSAKRNDFGQIGHPVLQLSDDKKVALESVQYVDGVMYANICEMGLHHETIRVTLAALRVLEPAMVGVTLVQGVNDNRFYVCAPIAVRTRKRGFFGSLLSK